MDKRIKIHENVSNYVEKLFFEYNATINILKYLTAQDNTKLEYIEKYFKIAEEKYIELELAKKEISEQYRPQNMFVQRYSFDFDNCEIVYAGGECND